MTYFVGIPVWVYVVGMTRRSHIPAVPNKWSFISTLLCIANLIVYNIIVNTPDLLLTIRLLYDIIVSMGVRMDILDIDDFFLDSLPRYYPEEYIQKKYHAYVKWVHRYFSNTVPMPFEDYLETTHMRVL